MFFYKFAILGFFFESSYIRYNIPKWISTFIWFWSCVCLLWPTRWHVKFFWTFRYFRLQSLHLISLIVKSLVCRNSTQFHIESLRKLNYCICTYGKRQIFLFFTGSFFYPTINILDIFMFYIKLFDKFSILCCFPIFLMNVKLNHLTTL